MNKNHWKYYNHSIVSTCAPHEEPDIKQIDNGDIWDIDKKALFVRFTSNFEHTSSQQWWYCIKDTPINLELIGSNQRYKINKGLKYVEIKKIMCLEYAEELFNCFQKATQRYKCYSNRYSKEDFLKDLETDSLEYYGAFFKETGELVAYSKNIVKEDYVDFSVIKFIPQYMKYQISAALIYTMIYDYINIQKKKYVCDGERCIRHKTNIQDYLMRMFGFRKAYCELNLLYRKPVEIIVKLIYPFRRIFFKFDKFKLVADVSAILKMEEIVRQQEREIMI